MASSAVRGFVTLLEKNSLSDHVRYTLALHYAKDKRLRKCELAGVRADRFGGNKEVADDESVDSMVRELASLATRACLRHGVSEPASLQGPPIDPATYNSVLSGCSTVRTEVFEPAPLVERASDDVCMSLKTSAALDEFAPSSRAEQESSTQANSVDASTQACFFQTVQDFITLREEFCKLRGALEREKEESRDRERRLVNQIQLLSTAVD